MAQNSSLPSKQVKVIAALLSHRTVEEAANAADIAPRTIYRWMQSERFRIALAQAQGEVLMDAVRALVADMQKNHEVMMKIRDDGDNEDSVRLRAAQALDNSLLRWRELGSVEERLAELERIVHNGSKNHR